MKILKVEDKKIIELLKNKRDIATEALKLDDQRNSAEKIYEDEMKRISDKYKMYINKMGSVDTKLKPKLKKYWKSVRPSEETILQKCAINDKSGDVEIEYIDRETAIKEFISKTKEEK